MHVKIFREAFMNTILRNTFVFFFFTFSLFLSAPSFSSTPIDTTIAPMLQNVLPAIVNIKAQIKVTDFDTMREILKQQKNQEESDKDQSDKDQSISNTYISVASGVIIDAKNGYIL